jgi:hypothetical protein
MKGRTMPISPRSLAATMIQRAFGSAAASVLAASLLAACAGMPTPIAVPSYNPGYSPGEELYAGNDVPALIRGNPFAMPEPEFDRSVLAAMQGWAFKPAHFVPAADPNAVYRVVLMLNPPNVLGGTLCARPLRAAPLFGVPPAPRVPVAAALCRADDYLAYAYGSIETEGGPDGDKFRRGIGQLVALLFPVRNPEQTPDRCRPPFC